MYVLHFTILYYLLVYNLCRINIIKLNFHNDVAKSPPVLIIANNTVIIIACNTV